MNEGGPNMNYWLCITTEENWNVIKEKNVWGIGEKFRKTIQKIKPGDKLVFYLVQTKKGDEIIPSRIVGIFEAVSETYKESNRIFKSKSKSGDIIYPYRVKIKPIKIFSKPIEFKPLIPKLKFIKIKDKWTGYVRLPMREIPEEDFQFIAGLSLLKED